MELSYIDRRIISNTGSMATHLASDDDTTISYHNSFSDISQYGCSAISNEKKIGPKDFYGYMSLTSPNDNDSTFATLIKNNMLPPFELNLNYIEYFSEHINPSFDGREKVYSVPFSPLNTEFFAKSMVFAGELKADLKNNTSNTLAKYKYDNNNNGATDYYNQYLTKYPNIAPAILFSSSLPIDTKKIGKLIYDDLKIPGMKQVPYTFCLWLGSKWHYYKHKDQIFMGQKSWTTLNNANILDINRLPIDNLYLTNTKSKGNAKSVPNNMVDLENYMSGVYVYNDKIIGMNEDSYYEINKAYNIVRQVDGQPKAFSLKASKAFSTNLNMSVVGQSDEDGNFYYETLGSASKKITKEAYSNTCYSLSFMLPTKITDGGHLSNLVDTGIGINERLLFETYDLLEDTTIDRKKTVGDMIGAGIVGNLKHYEFGGDDGTFYTIPTPIYISDSNSVQTQLRRISGNNTKNEININNISCSNKLDVIAKYYNGIFPGVFQLSLYPKFTKTRTVDINAIYSVTTYFTTDKSDISYIGESVHNEKAVFDSMKSDVNGVVRGDTNTTTFYNAFKNYILYNVKVDGKYINEIIGEKYTTGADVYGLQDKLNEISGAKIAEDDFITLYLYILMSLGDIFDKNAVVKIVNKDFNIKDSNKVSKLYDALVKKYSPAANETFSTIKLKSIFDRTDTTIDHFAGSTVNDFFFNADSANNVYIAYPKLLMDLFHGYVELSANSTRKFNPITRSYFGPQGLKSGFIKYYIDQSKKEQKDAKDNFVMLSNGIVNELIFSDEPTKVAFSKYFSENSDVLKLFICRLFDKIISEQTNNAMSVDQAFISNMSDPDVFVAKLYPSAGGAINLGYGLNTHLYTDVIVPEIPANNINRNIRSKRGIFGKTPYNTSHTQIATIIDPRVMKNYINKHGSLNDKFVDSENNFTDTLLRDNLENIRNSGLRYLWYSGPYFGTPTAQLSLDNIIFSSEGTVNNKFDISTTPRTNYFYNEKAPYVFNRKIDDNGVVLLEDNNSLRAKNKYSSYNDYINSSVYDVNELGPTVIGVNESKYLQFGTIVQQLGSDMLDQFESIFLDFCKTTTSNSSIINFDGVMKLLMRVDKDDLTDDLYYVYNYYDMSVGGTITSNSVTDYALAKLTKTQQWDLLRSNTLESDVDLINFVSESHNENFQLDNLDSAVLREKNTLAYLKNIVLTKGQYNKAQKVLKYLNSAENDVYVKRNWVQNSSDNKLIKFYTNSNNIELLTNYVRKNSNESIPENEVKTLYSRYIESLFDDNYTRSTTKINIILAEHFANKNLPAVLLEQYGYTDTNLKNRAFQFIKLLMVSLSKNNQIPNGVPKNLTNLEIAITQPNIEAALYAYFNKIIGDKKINYFSKNNLLYDGFLKSKEGGFNANNYVGTVPELANDKLLNFLKIFDSNALYDHTKFLNALFSGPVSFSKENTEMTSQVVGVYRAIINTVVSKNLDIYFDNSGKSWYLNTLIDEIELIVLRAATNITRLAPLDDFNETILRQFNNFLYSSYNNVQKYFDKHIESLVNVLQQSILTKNTDKGGLSYDVNGSVISDVIRIKPYYNIKKLHDTWLYDSINVNNTDIDFYMLSYYDQPCYIDGEARKISQKRLFGDYFHFVDRGNRDISNDLLFDIDWFSKYFVDSIESKKIIFNPTSLESSMYTFFGDIAKAHNCLFHALPSFNGIGLSGGLEPDNSLANEMFQTHNFLKFKEKVGPHFIFQYVGDVTSALDTVNAKVNNEKDLRRSFCLTSEKETPSDIKNGTNQVTGFIVQFGEQNQQVFSGINIDQSEFSNTEEYYDVITNLTKNGDVKMAGNDLYRIYDSRSYNATITSMGNMEIEPLMYFYLKNVPLFKGTYWITNVSHDITPNNIVTTFKGVRQPVATIKPSGELFLQLKKDNVKKALEITSTVTSTQGSTLYDEDKNSGLFRKGRLKRNLSDYANFKDGYLSVSSVTNFAPIINYYIGSELNDRILYKKSNWDTAKTDNELIKSVMSGLGKANLAMLDFTKITTNTNIEFAFNVTGNGINEINTLVGVSIDGNILSPGDWFKIPVGALVYVYANGGDQPTTFGIIIKDLEQEPILLHTYEGKFAAHYLYDVIAVNYKNGQNAAIKVTMAGIADLYQDSLAMNQKSNNTTVSDGYVEPFEGNKAKSLGSFDTVVEPRITINRYHLPSSGYKTKSAKFKYICLHHTAGGDNPYDVIDYWAGLKNRTSVEFVIGGVSANGADNQYDGQIVQAFPTGYTSNGSSAANSVTVGIELCSLGALTLDQGTYYTQENVKVNFSQVVKLAAPFRGYEYYHVYSDKQIDRLKNLILYIKQRNDIDIFGDGLVPKLKNLKKSNVANFYAEAIKVFNEHWVDNDKNLTIESGIFSHTNAVKSGKWDISPQPKLIDMLVSL